jgi:hypothetical protein
MALIASTMTDDSAFLLSIEEERRDAPEPSPPCSDDEDSVGMNSLEGNHDDDDKQWYERTIESPTGPLPYHDADADNENAMPYEFDLGMTGNWMCVYDLDSMCLDLDDNDNDSSDGQDVPVLPRYSHIPRCAPVMPIPAVPPLCSVSPSSSTSAPAIPTGFLPEHLREVFSTGLLPHVIEWFQGNDLAALSSSSLPSSSSVPKTKTTRELAWNGYLPLAPYSSLLSVSSSSSDGPPEDQRRKRRARSEIGKSMIRPRLSPPPEEEPSSFSPLQHVTLLAPNSFEEKDMDVELVYSSVCCFIFSTRLTFDSFCS